MPNCISAWIFGSVLKSTRIRFSDGQKENRNAHTQHTSACDQYSSRHLSPLPDTRFPDSGQVNEVNDLALDCSMRIMPGGGR